MEPQKGFQIFHTESNNRYQAPVVGGVLQQAPEKRIEKMLLNNQHAESIDINLRKFILLKIQSNMYLLCNE